MARLRDDYDSPLARPHGKRRARRRWRLAATTSLLVLLVGGGAAGRLTFALDPPHAVLPNVAVLSTDKRAALDQELDFGRPSDRDQAIDFALAYTAESLALALPSHRAESFEFGVGKRPGDAAEHAALFVAVLEAASKKAGSTARAARVKSPLRFFDRALPWGGLREHEWVLVFDPADGARIYLDPTLYDAWLGASISRNVHSGGAIALPPPPVAGPGALGSASGPETATPK